MWPASVSRLWARDRRSPGSIGTIRVPFGPEGGLQPYAGRTGARPEVQNDWFVRRQDALGPIERLEGQGWEDRSGNSEAPGPGIPEAPLREGASGPHPCPGRGERGPGRIERNVSAGPPGRRTSMLSTCDAEVEPRALAGKANPAPALQDLGLDAGGSPSP